MWECAGKEKNPRQEERAGSLRKAMQELKRELSQGNHSFESRFSTETGVGAGAMTSNLWPEFSPHQAGLCTCLPTLMSQNRN